jgi:hypothetical protein
VPLYESSSFDFDIGEVWSAAAQYVAEVQLGFIHAEHERSPLTSAQDPV